MAATIWEFFGYRSDNMSEAAIDAANLKICPIINEICEKTFNDNVVSGVCTVKPINSGPVICCPIRMYAENYQLLQNIADRAFGKGFPLIPGKEAIQYAIKSKSPCIAVFGQRWGGELRLPQKSGRGGYFVDWVQAKINSEGELEEFIAIEVQTIDTTGTYRNGYESLIKNREIIKTTAGLNWENVSKRILPQLIYKGQILQREDLCKKGLFFVCPEPVFERIMARLGGQESLTSYALQPASVTFLVYNHNTITPSESEIIHLEEKIVHSTTVYKLQEAFNNVTLPEGNAYKSALMKALKN